MLTTCVAGPIIAMASYVYKVRVSESVLETDITEANWMLLDAFFIVHKLNDDSCLFILTYICGFIHHGNEDLGCF